MEDEKITKEKYFKEYYKNKEQIRKKYKNINKKNQEIFYTILSELESYSTNLWD